MELQIKAKHPFIAQSVRIRVLKIERESICLRAEVYGCAIPRGKTRSFLDEDAEALYIIPSPFLSYDRFTNFDGSVVMQSVAMEVEPQL